jgi:hypothetical protein
MTQAGAFISSLAAMRFFASREIASIEERRHTHVLRKKDFSAAMIRYIALETMFMHVSPADVPARAWVQISNTPGTGTMNVLVGQNTIASVSLNQSADEIADEIATEIESFYAGLPVPVDVTVVSDEGKITVSAPSGFNRETLTFSGTGDVSGFGTIGCPDFSGGASAGQLDSVIPCAVGQLVYNKLAQYFLGAKCCNEQIMLSELCASEFPQQMDPLPTASIALSPGATILDWNFDGSGSVNRNDSLDESLMIYLWNFGDGTTQGPTIGLMEPTHSYSTEGVYTVCLTVTDESGYSHKTCEYVIADQSLSGVGYWIIEDDFTVQ